MIRRHLRTLMEVKKAPPSSELHAVKMPVTLLRNVSSAATNNGT